MVLSILSLTTDPVLVLVWVAIYASTFRSFRIVRIRAICRLVCPRCEVFSVWRVARPKRVPRRSALASVRRRSSSGVSSSRSSRAARVLMLRALLDAGLVLANEEARLDRQLVPSQAHCLLGHLARHAGQLENDVAGFDHGDIVVGSTLPFAHAGFGRLLGDRLIGKDPNPYFSASANVAGDHAPGGLDLTAVEPDGLDCLQPKLAERDLGAALGGPAIAAAHLLAMLDP